MYESLNDWGVLTEGQKGCTKATQGTNNIIFINKMVLKEAKEEEKNQLCVG